MVGAVKSGSANIGERASKLKLPEVRRPEGGGDGGRRQERPPCDPEDARLERLERLASLHEKGVLTDEELPPRRPACSNADDSRSPAAWRSGPLVGVCALSAAIGSSITLLAETGPPGKRGERGPRGPRGPEGPEGTSKARLRLPRIRNRRPGAANSATSARPKAASKNSKNDLRRTEEVVSRNLLRTRTLRRDEFFC